MENNYNIGIYQIKNKKNGKVYIGSSIELSKRLYHHRCVLNNNTHKNNHLQNAWNKYGEESFEFTIIEYCDKNDCSIREQYWMEKLQVVAKGYNINPKADRLVLTPQVIEKRRQTMLDNFKDLEFKSKYQGKTPWNKGKNLSKEHVQKLKDANRSFSEEGKKKKREDTRDRLPEVEVYSMTLELLGTFRSSSDLQEWSLTDDNNLPIAGRFKTSRKGKPFKYLSSFHINQCCTGKKSSYKGLIFKYKVA